MKVGAMSYAKLIKLMLEGIYSCAELAEHTGLHYVTVLEYTRALYREGAAHISSWEADCRGRDMIKVYKLGFGIDAQRRRKTGAERQHAVRVKRRHIKLCNVFAGATA